MDEPGAMPPPARREIFTSEVRCSACAYDLRGLSVVGTCPECGAPYTRAGVWTPRPPPSFASLAVRFGWPVALALLGAVLGTSRATGGTNIFGALFIISVLINTPIQLNLLIRSRVHRKLRTGWLRAVILLGRITYISVGAITLLTVLIPLILLIACLMLVPK